MPLFESSTGNRNTLINHAEGVGNHKKQKKMASSMDEEFEKA